MPQLQQLFAQIDELDPTDREQLAASLSDDSPSIVTTPDVCGGVARLIRTRVPVWTLERMRRLGLSEADVLRSYPNLKAVDLTQAWATVARHRGEIDQAIRENEAG